MKNFVFAVVPEDSENPDYSRQFRDLGSAVDEVSRLRNQENYPDAYIAVIDNSQDGRLIDELRNFYF